jgi:hypothetical protein
MNGYVNPNCASKQDIKLKVTEWRDMIDAGRRVCFIHGLDKPRVSGINGKFYFQFVDFIDNAVTANVQMLNRPWEFDEFFYWTPDLPEIVIKQAHVVKRFLKQATPTTPYITTDNTGFGAITIDKKIHWLTLNGVNHLVYPKWKPVLYQVKPPSIFFTPRDEWFFNLSDNDPAKYSWRVGLEHIWKITPDGLKKDPNKIAKGFKPFNSKIYEIGT